jgi:hypothetical protein
MSEHELARIQHGIDRTHTIYVTLHLWLKALPDRSCGGYGHGGIPAYGRQSAQRCAWRIAIRNIGGTAGNSLTSGAQIGDSVLHLGPPMAGSYPEPKLLLDAFNSDETAVMICAGAKGFCTSTLFGTPCEGQSSI